MDSKTKVLGLTFATAVFAFATLPTTSALADDTHSDKVHCYGVNSCKGKSACKTAKNACKGKNTCKGQGVSMKTEKKCTELKGSLEEPTA
jgi:uncharacterized membrane protein